MDLVSEINVYIIIIILGLLYCALGTFPQTMFNTVWRKKILIGSRVIPCQINPKKMKFETAPPQILIKLYTLPLCDYNRRPVVFF